MVLYLFANVNFFPGKYDNWQIAYDELAKYVESKEPTTLTYYFGLPFENVDKPSDSTLMFAFEAYGEKKDLYETHFQSTAMQTFLKEVPDYMSTGLDLMHYAPGPGFMDKPGNKAECKIMQDIRIFCKSPSAREAVLSRLEKVSKAVEEGSDGVYTYHSFSSLDDDKEVRIFTRFKDRNTMESHIRQPEILHFWQDSKDDIARMDHRAFFPNGKGWLHR